MLRTFQILSTVAGIVALVALADHWWDFGFTGVFLEILKTYRLIVDFLLGWAKPYAEQIAAYFKLVLPDWWKDGVVLYVTMGGATIRSSSYLLTLFSQQLRAARRVYEQRLAELEAQANDAEARMQKQNLTQEEADEIKRVISNLEPARLKARRRYTLEADKAYRASRFASVARFAGVLLWPLVWVLEVVIPFLGGIPWSFRGYLEQAADPPPARPTWRERLRTSFAVSSLYEFSKIVAGAAAFIAIETFNPL